MINDYFYVEVWSKLVSCIFAWDATNKLQLLLFFVDAEGKISCFYA